MTSARVLRLAANRRGRDFVVGDIHGTFSRVWEAMRAVAFDPAVDRLFSVGDLIDRGPESQRCAKFLAQPYVFAVRGNHEEDLLRLYEEGEPDERILSVATRFNGLGWWMDTSVAERRAILAALQRLPLVIEVETQRGSIGLLHAEVPRGMDWPTFVSKVESGDHAAIEACLWGRTRAHAGDQSGVPGVGRVFAGHTPQFGGPALFGNVCVLDTGAVFGELGHHDDGKLTLVNAALRTTCLARPAQTVGIVDVRDGAVPEAPFGASSLAVESVEPARARM